jgi:hypothetical protein
MNMPFAVRIRRRRALWWLSVPVSVCPNPVLGRTRRTQRSLGGIYPILFSATSQSVNFSRGFGFVQPWQWFGDLVPPVEIYVTFLSILFSHAVFPTSLLQLLEPFFTSSFPVSPLPLYISSSRWLFSFCLTFLSYFLCLNPIFKVEAVQVLIRETTHCSRLSLPLSLSLSWLNLFPQFPIQILSLFLYSASS